ncbi:2TM domain-containing protein [Flavobacterium sp. ANB]|uniref:2TM domain-containing protein n=1 Tax=unclassified Flavobacterium TaxID=196869 RepID=UPI0012B8C4E3|nr:MULTISPECIES: 2TM domain-containing protein [unclassified Flavobacterium]MBF4517963.1 2TM domain-containing protein [Flavobacterium sp. ANB]MTD71293.1 hypothetical protein [Flavobacterium sp. LC2016-13]
MKMNCLNDREIFELKRIASKKVNRLKSFYIHALIYTAALIAFVLKQYYGVSLNFFPLQHLNYVVMIIWTSVFLFSAIDLFVSFKIFGEEWEERKLKSLLEKKQKTQKWE